MDYVFKTDVSKKEFDEFVKSQKNVNFMQEYAWANIKVDFEPIYCGVYEKDTLIATCILLVRKLGFGLKLGYVPRGFLIDYSNLELLEFLTANLRRVGKLHKLFSIKIDPNFCINETNFNNLVTPLDINVKNYQLYNNNLQKVGFIHNKLYKDMRKTNQPRFNMSVPLYDNEGEYLLVENSHINFNKKLRRLFSNFYADRGVYFEKTNNLDDLDEFMSVINETEKRQGISLRTKGYFKNILENFDSYLFLGKLDLNKYLEYIKKDNEENDEITIINQLKEEFGDNICLSASLVIMPSNEEGLRVSEYLYTGNKLLFNKLNVSTGLVNYICKYSIEKKCHYCNLGGVEGTLDDDLSMFKQKFNPNVLEYAGEYDLVINKLKYYPINKLFPFIKLVYKKILRLINK